MCVCVCVRARARVHTSCCRILWCTQYAIYFILSVTLPLSASSAERSEEEKEQSKFGGAILHTTVLDLFSMRNISSKTILSVAG